jgi:hypothetical protein
VHEKREARQQSISIVREVRPFVAQASDDQFDLWFETQYIDTEAMSRRAVSLWLVRAECVRLAYAMKSRISDDGTLEQWIEAGKSDPLPGVRNVLLVSES